MFVKRHEVFESSVRFSESELEDTLSGSGASLPKPLAFRQLQVEASGSQSINVSWPYRSV